MQLNVLVICICYFARFVYDLVLLLVPKWFTNMRREQAKIEDGHRIYYSLFLFFLLFVVELCPICMFAFNLKFVFNHQAEITPRLPPKPKKTIHTEK